MSECFHCGLPAVDGYSCLINGEEKPFCCVACQSVAVAISDGGLGDFYRYRDAQSSQAESVSKNFSAYDLEEVQADFVVPLNDQLNRAVLTIGGISCAACAWLIEHRLQALEGVNRVSVNATNYRCTVEWSKEELKLSEIFSALNEIGYQPMPFLEREQSASRERENRNALLRMGVAGIAMMQVGMYAIALHAGAIQGMESHWQQFFRWVSLLIATPVVFYSAKPFFINAKRALMSGFLNMDVPVCIAISLAFVASIYATVFNVGEVYFDSIAMFTFFLLVGRYLEMKVRHSSAFAAESVNQLLPLSADRVIEEVVETVPLKAIKKGDSILVAAGAVIPCDGVVLEGESEVNESILTGESTPQLKTVKDIVFAGATNGATRLLIECSAVGAETQLSAIEKLVDQAVSQKPHVVAVADRIASRFVAFVLISAGVVGGVWWTLAPEKALWVVLSVLVATCPCALSLATPAALTAGTLRMRKLGLLITSPQFLEKLAQIKHLVFDKTGTLTYGELSVDEIKCLAEIPEKHVLALVSALEAHSQHPIAKAFAPISPAKGMSSVKVISGKGIEGQYNGSDYRFGALEYASSEKIEYPGEGLWQLLSRDGEPVAWVLLKDKVRPGISSLLKFLKLRDIEFELLSGDRESNVVHFASHYGFERFRYQALPQDKLERVETMQKSGDGVLMLGDGINDVPVLSAASVSIAMGEATRLAQTHADAIMVNGDLSSIQDAIVLSQRVRGKIRQNLMWAFGYNASILPMAALGWVPPYVAAIGMSLSSLLVVLNALRLSRVTFAPKSTV